MSVRAALSRVIALLAFAAPLHVYAQGFAYVSNYGSASVSVIDTLSNTVSNVDSIFENGPNSVVITPDGTHAYVADVLSYRVSIIDTSKNEVTGGFGTTGQPIFLAISPDGR